MDIKNLQINEDLISYLQKK